MNSEQKKSLKIGVVCVITYLVSYVARNILSVLTPTLSENGIFTKEYMGILTSVYLTVYALGQLVSGTLGDRVRSKYMVLIGCSLSGFSMLLFPFTPYKLLHFICFAALGFGLSMLRGPLMKIIAENTLPKAAENICASFSVMSFAGPLVASVLSVVFPWKTVFVSTALFSLFMGTCFYILISSMEAKGLITFKVKKQNIFSGFKTLISIKGFWFYFILGGTVEIVASSVTSWIPLYLTEFLSVSKTSAAGIYSMISILKTIAPIAGVFVYRHIIKDDLKIAVLSYTVMTGCFVLMAFTQDFVILNIALLTLAKFLISFAGALLWTIFIPRLSKYNVVSTGNGIFDFGGYAFASLANIFFSTSVEKIGWQNLSLVWALIVFAGLVNAIVAKVKYKSIME